MRKLVFLVLLLIVNISLYSSGNRTVSSTELKNSAINSTNPVGDDPDDLPDDDDDDIPVDLF